MQVFILSWVITLFKGVNVVEILSDVCHFHLQDLVVDLSAPQVAEGYGWPQCLSRAHGLFPSHYRIHVALLHRNTFFK